MRTKKQLFRLPGGTIAYLEMNTPGQIIKDKGLHKTGDAQQFHTANVLRRIKRYMPHQTGMTYKVTLVQTNVRYPRIITDVPYGQYLYRGKVMVNAKTGKGPAVIPGVGPRYKKGTILKATERDLEYTEGKNPQAGPYWDRALVANEGKVMAEELQRYMNRRT